MQPSTFPDESLGLEFVGIVEIKGTNQFEPLVRPRGKDIVAGLKHHAGLTILGQIHIGICVQNQNAQIILKGQDHGPKGVQKRAKGSQGKYVELWINKRSSGGNGIARRPRGRGHDHPVGSNRPEVVTPVPHVQADHARQAPTANNEIVDRVSPVVFLATAQYRKADDQPLGHFVFPAQDVRQRFAPIRWGKLRQKPDPAKIQTQDGYAQILDRPSHSQQRAVSAQRQDHFRVIPGRYAVHGLLGGFDDSCAAPFGFKPFPDLPCHATSQVVADRVHKHNFGDDIAHLRDCMQKEAGIQGLPTAKDEDKGFFLSQYIPLEYCDFYFLIFFIKKPKVYKAVADMVK